MIGKSGKLASRNSRRRQRLKRRNGPDLLLIQSRVDKVVQQAYSDNECNELGKQLISKVGHQTIANGYAKSGRLSSRNSLRRRRLKEKKNSQWIESKSLSPLKQRTKASDGELLKPSKKVWFSNYKDAGDAFTIASSPRSNGESDIENIHPNLNKLQRYQHESRHNNESSVLTEDEHVARFYRLENDTKDLFQRRSRTEKQAFRYGVTLQSTDPKYNGFAFTVGRKKGSLIEFTHVWLMAEKTYLGDKLRDLGIEWVRVKQHKLIPRSSMIKLVYLKNCIKLPDLDAATALCYEEDGSSQALCAYYYEQGIETNKVQYSNAPRVLDLCAGGGGMSEGLENAGFKVIYKV